MQKSGSSRDDSSRISVSRAGRLYRLLKQLSAGPQTRGSLLKKLKVGMRTFYRDVDLLRESGISIEAEDSGYSLKEDIQKALDRLPFPDPELTFGDIMTLMKGRTGCHQKLKKYFEQVTK